MRDDREIIGLGLAEMSFLTFAEKKRVFERVDDIHHLAKMSVSDISTMIERVTRARTWDGAGLERRVELSRRIIGRYGIRLVFHFDAEYPEKLASLYDPPFLLFVRGDVDCLHRRCVSVVGTRKPSREGVDGAFRFAEDAAADGMTVVSGLAFGIDACAHQGALRGMARDEKVGKTAAVVAGGVDEIYPVANRRIAAAIMEKGGAVLSEYLPGTTPEKWRFVQRNRLIAGLSEATVVVDAPEHSGALITAQYALDMGRDVYIHRVSQERAELGQAERFAPVLKFVADGAPVVADYEEYVALRDYPPEEWYGIEQASLSGMEG
ncbi:MAG: DNA-processing protein DprA [Spirochaetaceae bacterium]|jgi:DNA processing protein|nr:DNA-processing protein DprA [Spirochaetaceae bacterium]